MKGGQDFREEFLVVFHKGGHKIFVGSAVGFQDMGRCLQGTVEEKSGSVLEGMGEGDFRLNPAKAVSVEFQLPEEGRKDGQGVDRGADVMDEMGKGKLCGTDPAADRLPALQEKHGFKPSAQRDGRGQPVRSRTHNNDIVMVSFRAQSLKTCQGIGLGFQKPS